jgi:hypothetical protein
MSDRLFIKPTPQPAGQPPLKVRKPVNGHLAAGGEWVNAESYWLRRIADGDVVVDTEAVESTAEAAPDAIKPAKTSARS